MAMAGRHPGHSAHQEFMSELATRANTLPADDHRPDKLDSDIKRAGGSTARSRSVLADGAEVEAVLGAQLRKNGIQSAVDFTRRERILAKLVGYSNADVEAVVLVANDLRRTIRARTHPQKFDTFLRAR